MTVEKSTAGLELIPSASKATNYALNHGPSTILFSVLEFAIVFTGGNDQLLPP